MPCGDKAKEISSQLGMEYEFKKLNQLISDLLATDKSKNLTSPAAIARSLGDPLDPDRIKLFESLYEELAGKIFPQRVDQNTSVKSHKTFAFFEGYFSNYIEGTEFTVKEAKEIITTETPILARDEDSHDILGTYRIVSTEKKWQSVLRMPMTSSTSCEEDTLSFFNQESVRSLGNSKIKITGLEILNLLTSNLSRVH